MTKEELSQKLLDLNNKYLFDKLSIIRKYIDFHNPYKIGDTIEDHIGKIIIDKIKYDTTENNPQAVFYGIELTKKGIPRKDGSRRCIYQCNILILNKL